MESNNILEVRNLTKEFDGKVVLKDINFNIKKGEFITLLGPSGCGKTTILGILNGSIKQSSGTLYFNGINLTPIPSNKREINTIFQNYALFQHYNVYENVAYGLRVKKAKEEIIRKEVMSMLGKLDLDGYENKKISELSGGQKQRVAIARALVLKPKILLLDEPMSALDVKLKKQMQTELKELQEEVGITFILVTHDQEEALTMSDRIILLNNGSIQQIGSPEEIYNEPESNWVANFIGASNIINDATFLKDCLVSFDGKKFQCKDKGFKPGETNIDIIIRPEDIKIIKGDNAYFHGKITNVVFKGVNYEILVETENKVYKIHTTQYHEEGTTVGIKWNEDAIHVMWKEVDE